MLTLPNLINSLKYLQYLDNPSKMCNSSKCRYLS